MKKRVLVILGEGFEEVEAITPVDYMRRAGISVTTASLGDKLDVNGAHGIQIRADAGLESALKEDWDAVVVPGGLPGTDNIAASKEAGMFIQKMGMTGKLVAAICAAPARVLYPLGLLEGKKYTCFPGEEGKVLSSKAEWKQERVVVDGNLITSRAAGTAGEFACAIIKSLMGEEKISEKVLLF